MTLESNNVVAIRRKLFQPSRLTTARRLAGLSKTDLASKLGVSHAAVSQFEAGANPPSEERLEQIAEVLGFPVHYFTQHGPVPAHDDAFFRRRRKTPAAERQRALAYTEIVAQLVYQLQELVDLPEHSIPRAPVEPSAAREDVERIAEEARRSLGIEDGPAPRLARLLETRGCVVVRNADIGPSVDAFSRVVGDRSIIVLNTAKGDTMRTRFDLAHELGHLVMHDAPAANDKVLERQADQFAAAFLMPAGEIRQLLPATPQWPAYLRLKEQWGVSVAALIRRAHDLGVMTDHHYKRAQIELRQLKWHKQEPHSGNGTEVPVLWKKCLEVLAGAVEFSHIAEDAGVPVEVAKTALGFAIPEARPSVAL